MSACHLKLNKLSFITLISTCHPHFLVLFQSPWLNYEKAITPTLLNSYCYCHFPNHYVIDEIKRDKPPVMHNHSWKKITSNICNDFEHAKNQSSQRECFVRIFWYIWKRKITRDAIHGCGIFQQIPLELIFPLWPTEKLAEWTLGIETIVWGYQNLILI